MDKYLNSGQYLPEFLRDFHDQKLFFKMLHTKTPKPEAPFKRPNWMDGQVYVISYFLWFMAKRGYTLQKSRKKLDFNDIHTELNDYQAELNRRPLH
jgi:hypothetical protein